MTLVGNLEYISFRFGENECLAFLTTFLDIHLVQKYSTQGATNSLLIIVTAARLRFAYRANRKANGMLLSPPASLMIADETKGPTNADVFPTYRIV